jgi:benzoyl-CoA reductase/2-hydroxyglutaryl-CoA dehydratase subunit BcrC/BadD/HgdB
MAYLTESHRSGDGQKNTSIQLIDFPSNHSGTKEWSVEYVAAGLRRLTGKISELSGKHTTDDDLREVIIKFHTLRSLAREISYLCWEAEIPPLNSADFRGLVGMGNEPYLDVDAAISVLVEAKEEIHRRIAQGVKGFGVVKNPARLFVCGSCVTANPYLVDMAGGIVVSHDDGWSETVTDVAVEGDLYVNLAKAILSYPYERPTKERAEWTVEQVKQSRADGLIFIYNWGCNYQSAPARMLVDIVNEKAGIPSSHIGSSELGRSETVAQFHNRVEAFIEMLRLRKGFAQQISA